jgi:hypothetical protein
MNMSTTGISISRYVVQTSRIDMTDNPNAQPPPNHHGTIVPPKKVQLRTIKTYLPHMPQPLNPPNFAGKQGNEGKLETTLP